MKGSYGWDAPRVIRILFLIAILSVAAGGILFEIFDNFAPGLAWFLLWLTSATAAVCLVQVNDDAKKNQARAMIVSVQFPQTQPAQCGYSRSEPSDKPRARA